MIFPILDIKATDKEQMDKIDEEFRELLETIEQDQIICRKLEELFDVIQACFTMAKLLADNEELERAGIRHFEKLANRSVPKRPGAIKIDIMG